LFPLRRFTPEGLFFYGRLDSLQKLAIRGIDRAFYLSPGATHEKQNSIRRIKDRGYVRTLIFKDGKEFSRIVG